ncbi:uncharacterized protein [Prorops nasuta]|uniref:uncharacterized protein n=1 Tax=Prorops nasuta TaxID=863751 RepID=UPI0034CEC9E4
MRDTAEKVLREEECFEIIRKKLRQDSMDEFSLINYEIVPVEEVNGYMGQYFTLKATVACPRSPLDTKSINFFTKIPPPASSPQHEFMAEYGSFKKEVVLYTRVFPEVLDDRDKKCIPECFLGLEDDVIVLEDMVHSGYSMTNKFVPFDLEHCQVVMKTLARFHAKSLIFEEQCKKTIRDEFSHCLEETLWPLKDGRAKAMFDAAVKGTVSMIDLLDLDQTKREEFKRKVLEITMDHANKLSPSVKYKNVLCHGDLWANNILFKYDRDNKPVECCLIDFQLVRYNPPAHDIMCFLQFTTTRNLRDQHSDELFQSYYDAMTSVVKESELDIARIFPWDEFLQSINDLRTMCMTHGVLNTPIMLLESSAASKYFTEEPELLEEALYVDRTPLICSQFKQVPKYRERMQDALLELHDRVAG